MKKFRAILTYKSRDEIESRIMSETYARIIIDVYMTPEEFAKLIVEKSGKEFEVEFT